MGTCGPAPPPGGVFPPEDPERERVVERLSRPADPDHGPARWTLAQAREHCPELQNLKTDAAAWRRMRQWKISWKRGRIHLISPDPEYDSKLAAIMAIRAAAEAEPDLVRVLYADEASFYRTPERGKTWHPKGSGGRNQPKASHTAGANTRRRMLAAVDVHDGRVFSTSGSMVGVKAICAFLRKLRRSYGPRLRLVLVWDNWPVHYHADVLAAAREAGIELRYTPTYAPWTNPIEKLWKKLREEVLHLHRLSDKWVQLRQRVDRFLASLQTPQPELLRYLGLEPGIPN